MLPPCVLWKITFSILNFTQKILKSLISEARVDLVWPVVVVYTFNEHFLISSHYPRITFNINNTAPYHHQMCNWLFDIIVIETLPKKFMSFKETPKQFSGNGQKCVDAGSLLYVVHLLLCKNQSLAVFLQMLSIFSMYTTLHQQRRDSTRRCHSSLQLLSRNSTIKKEMQKSRKLV